ncbi:MAG: bifunctional precorrin-2 dehydrogenase/sirohydrochlorin ferrochelatase [Desulfofustis sp.]|nr:bifunctional precorrin-2 dehydrogenase/sirohydrochlorin ferrochelatase [Desulfofustis sp.]
MNDNPMTTDRVWYPVNLDISGRLCLVVGGGIVAARKISALLLSRAVVRVVSPESCGKVRRLAEEGRIELLERPFQGDDLAGVFLVFAATNSPQVQNRIAEQARRRGILLNSAENPGLSSFLVPARVRRGDFLLAVSTGGASPALSALIKRKLALQFGPEYALLVHLLAGVRSKVVQGGERSSENRTLFQDLVALPVLEKIRERDWDGLRVLLKSVLPAGVDGDLLVRELAAGERSDRREER